MTLTLGQCTVLLMEEYSAMPVWSWLSTGSSLFKNW